MSQSQHEQSQPTSPQTISAMEARKRFGQILEETYYRGDTFIIERSGRPMAAIVPIAAYTRLEETPEERPDEKPTE